MSARTRKTMLLATDQQQSVLNTLDGNGPRSIAYTPYGHRSPENGLLSLLGFNGEPPDALSGHYHLGNGYRQFNPVLMRFNSPDSWSPFGEGGLNAYAYCGGEPVNRNDRTGHMFKPLIKLTASATEVASPGKNLLKIPEVVAPSMGDTAKTIAGSTGLPGTGSITPTTQIKNPRTLPSTIDVQFRKALELAVSEEQPIALANNVVPPPAPGQVAAVRPPRSRNRDVIGGDSDFARLKIQASKLPEPVIQNRQVRNT
ncbi:RHS repeat-associated core domain-containing protein [Pseudomonas sp. TNT3]|nr:RHS repeat-associated core domain-containing protein [Pseudomonas sp. TNT3]KAI2693883.1 RHS repeat-associated core domain-containing protein [Pseudomonas sp. TNT3]